MIELTKLNGGKISVNPATFEMAEETPDTVLTLTTGRKLIVKESRTDIEKLVKLYYKELYSTTI